MGKIENLINSQGLSLVLLISFNSIMRGTVSQLTVHVLQILDLIHHP